jgi:hypothetical protein
MTREEILSIEGVKEDLEMFNPTFWYNKIDFQLINGVINCITVDEGITDIPIKPIADIETLKQFLNYFD